MPDRPTHSVTLLPAPIALERGPIIMTIGTMPDPALRYVLLTLCAVDFLAELADDDSAAALRTLASVARELYEVKLREFKSERDRTG